MSAALDAAWMVAGTMAEILLVVFVGAIGAHLGIIPAHMRKELSKLCMSLLLPPFLFIKLSRSISLSLLYEWWLIPAFVVLNLIVGLALGVAFERLLGRRVENLAGTFVVACGVGNAGTIPMAVMYSVCDQNIAKFAGREGSCSDDAMAMLALGVAVAAGFFWTFGPSILRSRNKVVDGLEGHMYKEMEEQREEKSEEKTQHACLGPQPCSIAVEAAAGHNAASAATPSSRIPDTPSRTAIALPFSPCMHGNPQLAGRPGTQLRIESASDSPSESPPSTPGCIQAIRSRLSQAKAFLNSASVAVLAGLFCGCIPPVKALLHGDAPPLQTVTSAMELIGSSVIPLMLLVLGANLVSSGEQGGLARLDPLVAVVVSFVRLLLLPVIGMGLVHLLKRTAFLGPDPLMEFVLLVQVSIYGNSQEMGDAAQLALYQYLFATPLLTCALIAYTTVQL